MWVPPISHLWSGVCPVRVSVSSFALGSTKTRTGQIDGRRGLSCQVEVSLFGGDTKVERTREDHSRGSAKHIREEETGEREGWPSLLLLRKEKQLLCNPGVEDDDDDVMTRAPLGRGADNTICDGADGQVWYYQYTPDHHLPFHNRADRGESMVRSPLKGQVIVVDWAVVMVLILRMKEREWWAEDTNQRHQVG